MDPSQFEDALDQIQRSLADLESRLTVLEALALEKAERRAALRPLEQSPPIAKSPLENREESQGPPKDPDPPPQITDALGLQIPPRPVSGPTATSAHTEQELTKPAPEETLFPPHAEEPLAAPLSLEQRIGGRWFTWLGAASLALAVAFFVPWAWRHFQMPPAVRVLIFHAMGVALLVGALVLRNRKLVDLAHGIAGLGVFVLYASAFAMEHHYELFRPHSNLAGLLDCTLITCCAVYAAVRYNSIYIIVLGALGGYVIPLIPPHAPNDFNATFAYLAFLNLAVTSAATIRPWQFLKPLAVAATAVMFLFWFFGSRIDSWRYEQMLILHALIFLAATNLPQLMFKKETSGFDLTAAAGNSLFFVGGTWMLFHDRPAQQIAMVCWGISLLHGVLFGATYARLTNADRLPRLHLALAAVFLTLAIPLQMRDTLNYLAYAWSIEAFVFTAIGVYFRDRQLTSTGAIVFGLAVLRAMAFDFTAPPELVAASQIDRRFLVLLGVGCAGIAAGSCYWWVDKIGASRNPTEPSLDRATGAALAAIGNLLILAATTCQWDGRTVLVLWTIDAAVLWVVALASNNGGARTYAFAVSMLLVGGRAIYHHGELASSFTLLANARFASLVLVAALYLAAGWFERRRRQTSTAPADETVGSSAIALDDLLEVMGNLTLLAAITFEIHNVWQPTGDLESLLTGSKSREEHVAYSVVWSIYAALLVAIGFLAKYRTPRLLGLAGLLVVAAKVFFVDLANLPLILRVLALAALGGMLLVTSFWYQKYTARIDSEKL